MFDITLSSRLPRRWGRLAACSLLIGAATLSLGGCDKGTAKDAAEEATAAIPVQVDRPTRGEMLSVYAGTAPLQADQEATVVAKVGGEVREILVEEGDVVKAGQVLARLDGDRLRFELQQTEVNLRKLEREYQRTVELLSRKLVAASAVDNARSEMEWLKAARDLAQLNVGYTEIRAPIAGVVSARHIKVGNTINVNDRTFQVTDLDPLIAEVHVPEREFAKLRADQATTIVVDALAGANFVGRVQRISPTLDPATGTFKATIEVLDPKHALKPGMFARVGIVLERRSAALRIPRGAIVEAEGAPTVFIANGDKAEQRSIRTGLTNAGLIEVIDGLSGDERIVVVGQNGLKSGSSIRLIDEPAPRTAVVERGSAAS
ncbi:MAG TPA: efflux RND transporter periplasmic adaptor subunit [Steroidobacteraceae bacterium]|nr:efflux RND transporter periplasmic adaptor subunit [Steroidobacteraceae bacterium]